LNQVFSPLCFPPRPLSSTSANSFLLLPTGCLLIDIGARTHTHTPILLFSVQYMRVRQRSNSRCIQTHICHQCCKVTALYLSCVHAFVYSMSIRIVGPMHCIAALNPIVIVHSPPSLPFPSSGLCACVHRLGNFFKNPPCDVSVESVEGEATPREAEECCQHVDHQSLYL
jgi:hypothetical protein